MRPNHDATIPTRPRGIGLRAKIIWMTGHLSGVTKFITLIPIETLDP
jgi:hypothetical protein